jgi:molybdopterin converting factor subunit 1
LNTIKIHFFASLRDRAGVRTTNVEIANGATIADLKTKLLELYPGLGDLLHHCLASINYAYVFDEAEIPADAEIAFFPPVSGG